jgi:hypothetical protein
MKLPIAGTSAAVCDNLCSIILTVRTKNFNAFALSDICIRILLVIMDLILLQLTLKHKFLADQLRAMLPLNSTHRMRNSRLDIYFILLKLFYWKMHRSCALKRLKVIVAAALNAYRSHEESFVSKPIHYLLLRIVSLVYGTNPLSELQKFT